LKLRDIIGTSILDEDFNQIVPAHIIDKVGKRIQNTLKKNPVLNSDDFKTTRKKLDYFDLQEYCDVIVSKSSWDSFEARFKNKSLLMEKFSKLGELRNSIRHTRDVDEVTLLEGKAAIIWIDQLL
jgi:hypothetical protein